MMWYSIASSGVALQVLNPATGETIANIGSCASVNAMRAVACTEAALPAWRSTLASDRARILLSWRAAILKRRDDIVQIMTAECGKPLAEARSEVAAGVTSVEWFAGEALRYACRGHCPRCTCYVFTPIATGLSGLFFGDDCQQLADWHPGMCSPGRCVAALRTFFPVLLRTYPWLDPKRC
jgi:delta 1-pyrroline-5-carboxylate dehydrogenase